VQDDAYLPARTLDNLQRVISEGSAFALMSTMGTGNTATILPLVEQAGIPLVGPVTGAHSLRLPSQKYTFHVRPSYRDEVARVTQELVTIGLKDIAVVYLDNPFGHEVRRDAQAGLEAQKVNAVGSWALAVDGRNAEEVVAHILASRAGAVFLGTTGTATTALVKSLRARAAGLPIAGLSVSVISSEIPKLGSSIRGVAVAAVMPDALQEKHPVVRSYQATLREAGVKDFGGSSFEGWMNAQVMIEGLRRAGRDLTRERLRAALAGLRSLDLGGFTLGYAGSAPFVASRFIELAVFGADGKRVG
jgi:branched-chain amino acid transport system substrate-binding protein